MNINEVFKKIRKDLDLIKVTSVIREQYSQLENYLINQNLNIIHSFSQIKRNQQFKGLVSETMLIDNKQVYDIVVGVDNLDINVILTKHISRINIVTTPNYINEKKKDGSSTQKVELNSQLNIISQEHVQFYYQTSPEKYSDLLIIADTLTKMIAI